MHTEISQKEDSRHGQSRQLLHFLDKETIKLRGIDRTKKFRFECLIVIVVQLPSSVRLFATPWTQHARLPCPSPSSGVSQRHELRYLISKEFK